MAQQILIVDDERDIIEILKYNLEKEVYDVLTATNGRKALERSRSKPDLIVLDAMMPEMDGWEVCRRLKGDPNTTDIPIIFLTARGSEFDEVLGLELGASDYIIKPISPRRIVARIKAVLRRGEPAATGVEASELLRIDQMEVNVPNYTVRIGKQELFLPKKEFETLVYLAKRRGRVISRETLLDAIWGENANVVDRTVDVHISKLREKIGKYGEYIETVKGVGYRFRA